MADFFSAFGAGADAAAGVDDDVELDESLDPEDEPEEPDDSDELPDPSPFAGARESVR